MIRALLTVILCVALASTTLLAQMNVQLLTASPHAWSLAEFRIDPGTTYQNPFNPDEVTIDAKVSGPNGLSYTMPAFWYQAHQAAYKEGVNEAVLTTGESFWMLRLCPQAAGDYSVQVVVKDQAGARTLPSITFKADSPADQKSAAGFVRVAPNKRYFAFDSGAPYYIIGMNMGWGRWGHWADQFDNWFEKLSSNGGNFARIWTTEQKWKLEPQKLGQYDLAGAAFYDDVLAAAQKRGVYIMLTFVNHRDLIEKDMWGSANWQHNAYNAAKGGPATRPVDFFSHPAAIKAFKNRLRYAVARYSAYRSLGFWELFNEQEHAGLGTHPKWNQEMSDYIATIDPYRHLISTSGHGLEPAVWKLPNVHLAQAHYYGDDTTVDLVRPMATLAEDIAHYDKPYLLAEFGISYKRSDISFDEAGKGTELHNSLYAAMMAGTAGGACHWWWDNYIEPKNLWHTYKPFAEFASRIDWARRDYRPLTSLIAQHDVKQETYTDLRLPCTIDWQKGHGQPITISPAGKPDRPLPRYLYGPAKLDLRAPYVLHVDLPKEAEMVLDVTRVSDFSMIRVAVDNKPVRDFAFSALPGDPEIQSTKPHSENGPYQAEINKKRRVTIPAGQHKITLENTAGDWIRIEAITFTNAMPSRYQNLEAMGLQDASTSQTLLWIQDTRSNWKNDKEGTTPTAQDDVLVTVPLPQGSYTVTWFDTRKGADISRDTIQAGPTPTLVKAPRFTRDIAAIIDRSPVR